MNYANRNILFFILICSGIKGAQAQNVNLEPGLDKLYSEVAERFQNNPYFRNSDDPELNSSLVSNQPMLPEYEMPTIDAFKNSLKAYCVLRESENWKRVKNRRYYGILDFSKSSNKRRLFVYDIEKSSIVHALWGTHGVESALPSSISLYKTSLKKSISVVKLPSDLSLFFSSTPGSKQSSLGMALAAEKLHTSPTWGPDSLALVGIDPALNATMRERAIIFHPYSFNAAYVRGMGQAPFSEGCPMLPKLAYYKGQDQVPVAKVVSQDLLGAPIFFYHPRLIPTINQSEYLSDKDLLERIRNTSAEEVQKLTETKRLGIPATQIMEELDEAYFSDFARKLEITKTYFLKGSQYFRPGSEPTEECLKTVMAH